MPSWVSGRSAPWTLEFIKCRKPCTLGFENPGVASLYKAVDPFYGFIVVESRKSDEMVALYTADFRSHKRSVSSVSQRRRIRGRRALLCTLKRYSEYSPVGYSDGCHFLDLSEFKYVECCYGSPKPLQMKPLQRFHLNKLFNFDQ